MVGYKQSSRLFCSSVCFPQVSQVWPERMPMILNRTIKNIFLLFGFFWVVLPVYLKKYEVIYPLYTLSPPLFSIDTKASKLPSVRRLFVKRSPRSWQCSSCPWRHFSLWVGGVGAGCGYGTYQNLEESSRQVKLNHRGLYFRHVLLISTFRICCDSQKTRKYIVINV